MNFFRLLELLDPDLHSECGTRRQIECGSGSETLAVMPHPSGNRKSTDFP
jgi:hypothetical protein